MKAEVARRLAAAPKQADAPIPGTIDPATMTKAKETWLKHVNDPILQKERADLGLPPLVAEDFARSLQNRVVTGAEDNFTAEQRQRLADNLIKAGVDPAKVAAAQAGTAPSGNPTIPPVDNRPVPTAEEILAAQEAKANAPATSVADYSETIDSATKDMFLKIQLSPKHGAELA